MKKEEDKWVNNLRQHMEDYSEILPPHGWEDLEKALSSPRVVPMWRTPRFVAAAAAFVVAVSSLSVWLVKVSSDASQQIHQIAVEQTSESEVNKDLLQKNIIAVPQNQVAEEMTVRQGTSSVLHKAKTIEVKSASSKEPPALIAGMERAMLKDESVLLEEQKHETDKDSVFSKSQDQESTERNYALIQKEDRKTMVQNQAAMSLLADGSNPAKGWSVGVVTGNTPYSASNTFGGFSGLPVNQMSLPVGDALTSTSDVNSAYKQVLFNNRDKQTWTDVNHKMPVTVGASVKWNITEDWAVETGLNYTFMESEFRSGSDASYWNKVQKLHYVGIPLKVHRKVWNSRWVSFYAAAGGMMEKCISGSEDILLVRSAQEQTPESHSLNVKPLQWSVQAAVGAQVNFTKQFGLYVEPGMAYYFDDGSEVETIRKEHPFNFNLQMGLRFSFAK